MVTEQLKKKVKKRAPKEKVTKIIHKSVKEVKVENALIENFISFQRVMINLSSRFDELSEQISKLLEMFEIAAKYLAKKDLEPEENNRNMSLVMEKLDNISQQAGLIGKGLALMHESGSGKYQREPTEIKPVMAGYRRYEQEPMETKSVMTESEFYKREPSETKPIMAGPEAYRREPPSAVKRTGLSPGIRGYQKSLESDSTQSTTPLMNQKTSEEK